MVSIRFADARYACRPKETVLDALLRQDVSVPFSCKNGVCLTCMLRASEGGLPAKAQAPLKETLRAQGYFLSCLCQPTHDMAVALPDDASLFGRARVVAVDDLAPQIRRMRLAPATPLYYHAGQFVNLRRADGLQRSYSLASVPRLDSELEIHVKRLPGGAMSNWVFHGLKPGDTFDLQGPNGDCFYLPGRPRQPLLLIANGSGLGALLGIARDALHTGHRGPVALYHGSRQPAGLYLRDALAMLAAEFDNFRYHPCLSGEDVPDACRPGRAEVVALADNSDLKGWRVFLCGYPPMVAAAKRNAFLAGAALADIHTDPFELQELRDEPRP